MKIFKIDKAITLTIFIIILSSCVSCYYDKKDDCDFSDSIPVAEPYTAYIISNAGTEICNGEYEIMGTSNDREVLKKIKSTIFISYDYTNGWVMADCSSGCTNSILLYYTNNHETTLPINDSVVWIAQDGALPLPALTKENKSRFGYLFPPCWIPFNH